jgi:hypothetical protein
MGSGFGLVEKYTLAVVTGSISCRESINRCRLFARYAGRHATNATNANWKLRKWGQLTSGGTSISRDFNLHKVSRNRFVEYLLLGSD